MISKYITINAHIYFARKIVVLFLLLLFIPNGLLGKKKPFIGKDRYNRQISEGVENNGDTLSVTYIAFHPFQIDTTKMAVNKIAGRLTKQEIDIFKNFAEVYKFADEGPKEELYVVQGSQIDSIFYDGLFGFKKIVIPSDANKKFSHYYEKGLKEGEWIEWFVDESPREIYNYKKDLLEGPYAIYDSASAQKIIEKMYKKDLLHGVWKEWYLDNTLKLEYSYKNDNLHGVSIDYDSTGKKDSEKMYKEGLKDGEWNFYNDDVVLVRVEVYNDDLKDGLWYTKDLETRDIHYEEYREDKFIVRYTEHYYPNFQLMEKYAYKDSLPHGKWIGYYKDGETKHVKRFEDGKKQGKWQYYTELGDVHTLELFENDKRNGEWYKRLEGKDIQYQFWDMDSLISEYADLHYPNGQLKEKISYKEGLKDGKFTGYYQNGSKKYVKRYEDDIPAGKWQYYTMAGKTNAEEIYVDGKRDDEWYRLEQNGDVYYQFWDMDSLISEYADLHYPNGQLIEKISYKEGLKDGKFTGYYESGETKHKKKYTEDKPDGKWQFFTAGGDKNEEQIYAEGKKVEEWYRIDEKGDTYYQFWDQDSLISEYADLHYSNGQLIEKISYKEGLPMGEWKFVKEDGSTKKIERYEMGKKNEEWITYEENGDVYYQYWVQDSLISEYADLHYPNGQLIEKISYKEGKKNGKFTGYYESGQTKYIRTYKDDKLEGKYADYTESGQILLKQSYVNDLLDGASKEWYLNGKVKVKTSYTAGKLNGGFMSYDSLGRKETKGEYEMGLKTGDWLTWYPSGKKKERLSYFSGKANGMYSLWDEEGRIIKEGEYSNDLKHGVWITFDPDLKRQESYEYYDMGVAKLKYFFKYYDNGNLMEEPSFTEYFRDGEWRQLFDNERLQYLTTYSMGKKYGLYEEWTINKELVQRGYYEYDLMSALWTYAKNDSVIKYEVYDADSIIDGFVYEYYENDQSKADAVFLENGKRDQKWYTYFEEGKDSTISVYDGGKMTGTWYVNYDSTFEVFTETNYENNLKHGDYKEWYIDENPMVEGYYEYGKKHLLWAFWDERGYQRFEEWRMGELYDTFEYEYYDNGQLKEEPSYKNRKKHGKWFRYFPDGEISGVREFANGKRVGEWVDYYRKDEIAFQGIYKDDKKDGPWIWYYMNRGEPGEEGNVMSEVKFSNGELISEKCYKREDNQEINCQEIFGENDYRFAEKK